MRTAHRQEFIPAPNNDVGGVFDGTVGWGDGKDHYDRADGEPVFVKVTLFAGYNADRDGIFEDGRAHGQQVLCRINAQLQEIPPDGAYVVVAVPAGRLGTPGGSVIIAKVQNEPANQFSANRVKMDFGPDVDLILKARSITFSDYEDRYFTLGPTYGIKMGDADANGAQLKDGAWTMYVAGGDPATARSTLRLDATQAAILTKSASGKVCNMQLSEGKWIGCGTRFNAIFSAGALGNPATIDPTGTPAVSGIAHGASTPSVPSSTWMVAT